MRLCHNKRSRSARRRSSSPEGGGSASPAPEPDTSGPDDTCTSCLEVCFFAEGEDGTQLLVCDEECQGGHACPMHDEREAQRAKAELMQKLFGPPTSPKPPHQNQRDDGEESDFEGGRLFEL